MAWYRAGGGGIPAALKTGMNDVLNKKFGTSTTYAPNTWPDNVNLLGKLPEKTVSGAIAHIEDGADRVPVKNWQVTLGASLSGVSSLTCKQAGKNLISTPEYTVNTPTLCLDLGSNITFSSVMLSFLATNTVVSATNAAIVDFREEDGTHHYLALSAFYNENNVQFVANTPQNGRYRRSYANITFRYVYIYYMSNSYSVFSSDSVTEWQLEVGNVVSDYAPYVAPTTHTVNLGRTIYGGRADVVNGTGTDDTVHYELGKNDSWSSYSGANHSFWHNVGTGEDRPIDQTKLSECICNHLTYFTASPSSAPDFTFLVQGGQRIVVTADSTIDTVDKFKTWLETNPLVFTCPASSSNDFTFTPITPTPETALGVNNFWSDGDSQVTYRRDIDLALGGA